MSDVQQESILLNFGRFHRGMWVWCLHCQRVYKAEEFKLDRDGLQECPYKDCSGCFMDAQPWADIVKLNKYPKIPQRGVVYALYPKRK